MERKRAQGLAAIWRLSAAANEEIVAPEDGAEQLAHPQPPWDPYEVWRTRVKTPAAVSAELERDPPR
jgi:hypothetical protein